MVLKCILLLCLFLFVVETNASSLVQTDSTIEGEITDSDLVLNLQSTEPVVGDAENDFDAEDDKLVLQNNGDLAPDGTARPIHGCETDPSSSCVRTADIGKQLLAVLLPLPPQQNTIEVLEQEQNS